MFGTKYKKGMFLIVKEGRGWTFASIMLILVSREEVIFIVKLHQSTYLHSCGLYQVQHRDTGSNDVVCVVYSKLMDFCPLLSYKVDGRYMINRSVQARGTARTTRAALGARESCARS